jgi:hypothetical protein
LERKTNNFAVATPAELPGSHCFNSLDLQTVITGIIEPKGLVGEVTNLARAPTARPHRPRLDLDPPCWRDSTAYVAAFTRDMIAVPSPASMSDVAGSDIEIITFTEPGENNAPMQNEGGLGRHYSAAALHFVRQRPHHVSVNYHGPTGKNRRPQAPRQRQILKPDADVGPAIYDGTRLARLLAPEST